MTTAIKRRRGTTTQHSTFTGLEGEITIDTTKDTVVVHDGATAGGFPLAKESGSAIAATTLSASGAFTANGGATLGDASGDALTINSSAVSIPNGLNFDSNTLVIDATNNRVVINNSSSLSAGRLSLLTDTSAENGIVVKDSATTYANNNNYLLLQNSTGTTSGALTHVASASLGVWGNDDIRFLTTGGATERMRIDSSGNVGIGTSSPSKKLDVNGDALIYGITVGRGGGAVATNTAVGASALAANTTGYSNSAFGSSALTANTDGYRNNAFGKQSLVANTSGYRNNAFGEFSLYSNTTGADNVAVGHQSLYSNTTANNNTAVGYQSGYSNTTGAQNTFVGRVAGYSNTTGGYNTNIGNGAGYTNSTGGYNTAIGEETLFSNTASNNTAVGWAALYSNTTGTGVTALGYKAGYSNTTANSVTAIGYTALQNSTGAGNTAVGESAATLTTTGIYNSVLGVLALYNNTTGSYNTAMGLQALTNNTTASNNTAVGYQAGYSNTTGTQNTFIGTQAGYSYTGSNGYNTAIGRTAGYNLTTGYNNTFVGGDSGYYVTTGTRNTILGMYNGNQGGLDIRTASNYIVLSDGDGNPRGIFDGSGNLSLPAGRIFGQFSSSNILFLGAGTTDAVVVDNGVTSFYPYADNTRSCGYSTRRWTTVYATTGTINTSDANQKQQIRSLDSAELAVAKRIKGLIKAYKLNASVTEKGDNARIHIGVIAQEVQAAFIAEGLDPSKYGMFCSDTHYEVDGKDQDENHVWYTKDTPNAIEVTQLGIRYEELLAFVIATL